MDGLRLAQALVACSLIFWSGCWARGDAEEWRRANAANERGQSVEALHHVDRLLKMTSDASLEEEASLFACELSADRVKNYERAVEYCRRAILVGASPGTANGGSPPVAGGSERKYQAQKRLAFILYSNLQRLPDAITELNRFLELKPSGEDYTEARMALARAYFYSNNFFQARTEAEALILHSPPLPEATVFDAFKLKASALQAEKELEASAETLFEAMRRFPKRAEAENLAVALAVVFEELRDFRRAIEVLEKVRGTYPDPRFIDRRIATLRQRSLRQPGARGLSK